MSLFYQIVCLAHKDLFSEPLTDVGTYTQDARVLVYYATFASSIRNPQRR